MKNYFPEGHPLRQYNEYLYMVGGNKKPVYVFKFSDTNGCIVDFSSIENETGKIVEIEFTNDYLWDEKQKRGFSSYGYLTEYLSDHVIGMRF